MSNTASPDLGTQMRQRIRTHMLVSLGGLLAGFAGIALSGGLFGKDPSQRWLLAIGVTLSIAVIPVIGFWSTFKFLRCPACEGMVAWQVSANVSLFANQASKQCRHCNRTIFDDRGARFIRNLAVVAVVLGFVAAIVNTIMHRH